ncbi:hypothetical protein HMPREF9080_02257 [Cardiobacterium valvarum F0432]|uniref:Uncharacterized protein n=1 Tax=Cardiobacterium valvarum F0432 TaxID=797473 RepID=G9ZHJ9_9GAMM|nr:hypothetical protein HMPREF9080_02257 [Cardiobacterium valvarum F0432]
MTGKAGSPVFIPLGGVIPFSLWGQAGMGVGQIALATNLVPQG